MKFVFATVVSATVVPVTDVSTAVMSATAAFAAVVSATIESVIIVSVVVLDGEDGTIASIDDSADGIGLGNGAVVAVTVLLSRGSGSCAVGVVGGAVSDDGIVYTWQL